MPIIKPVLCSITFWVRNRYRIFAHKDYAGPAIQMRIYDRSIELWNYGLLPEELTPADLLKKHSSYPRNHNIANVFYKAGFVGSWGRGYKKIAEEFDRAKMSLPIIEETGGGVMAIIQRKTMDEVIAERGSNVGDMSETNVGDQTYCSPTCYHFYNSVKPCRFCQTNVGDFVGDFKNDRKGFVGNAKSWHYKA